MRILILGAGPTGLGAAYRLTELGHDDWMLLEAGPGPGGLARSRTDSHGFTWDCGVHVLHSHYDYFDKVMDGLSGVPIHGPDGYRPFEWLQAKRSAWAWIRDQWCQYPVQRNFWQLDPDSTLECLHGILDQELAVEVRSQPRGYIRDPANFDQWITQKFGVGLADMFMRPFNRKVWGVEPREMNTAWVGDRVAVSGGLRQILADLVCRQPDTGWGPNATFRYPVHGGTGAIWEALASKLPRWHSAYGARVEIWDPADKRLRTVDRWTHSYDAVISTIPLDELSALGLDLPRVHELKAQETHVVGVGYAGSLPECLRDKSWVYVPDPKIGFYRATVLSNLAPSMAPAGCWSILCELGGKQPEGAVVRTLAGLKALGWCAPGPNLDSGLVSAEYMHLEHGYPVPSLDRDAVLVDTDSRLRKLGIWSRGRFGAWRYERGNQDHSFMMGVEAVDSILTGAPEPTIMSPRLVCQ